MVFRLEYINKSRNVQEQLSNLRHEIDGLKKGESTTSADTRTKQGTLRKVRGINTFARTITRAFSICRPYVAG
jgi:hypothetical protein